MKEFFCCFSEYYSWNLLSQGTNETSRFLQRSCYLPVLLAMVLKPCTIWLQETLSMFAISGLQFTALKWHILASCSVWITMVFTQRYNFILLSFYNSDKRLIWTITLEKKIVVQLHVQLLISLSLSVFWVVCAGSCRVARAVWLSLAWAAPWSVFHPLLQYQSWSFQ